MAAAELVHELRVSHLGEMNRWKCTHNPHTEIHRGTQSLFLPGDMDIWQLRSISCKHVESVCWTDGASAGSQPAMWRCNSLMKSMCTSAWVQCVYVCVSCMCWNTLVFSQFDTLAGLVMASRSRATSVGAKTVKVPLSVLGTTAGIQTSVTFV